MFFGSRWIRVSKMINCRSAEFDWKYNFFWNIKQEKWDLKVLWFNYWSDLALGSVETDFLAVGAYVRLKGATAVVWLGRFCWIWLEISHFLSIRTEEWDVKFLLFNYWNYVALGLVEIKFFEVGAYVSLKGATAGVWEDRFCWLSFEISHFLKYKNEGVGPKNFMV